jgi:hypothetical protein
VSLWCWLGFSVCLTTQGVSIPGDRAVELLDSCNIAPRYSVNQFEGYADQGNLHIEYLLNRGLPGYVPADTAAKRRANLLRACRQLERDFNDDGKWKRSMSWTWALPIVQMISCTLMRWVGHALFSQGLSPNFGNLPLILMGRPRTVSFLLWQCPVVSLAVIITGFAYANHSWLLLLGVVITFLWASPPYRTRAI